MIDEKEYHRKFAIECFNNTWELLENNERTPDDDIRMIHMAHASRFHWGEVGTTLNFARGDWQVSRVYAVLGLGNNALYYAKFCLHLCLENGIGDFDLAFAYESMARAYDVLNDIPNRDQLLELAQNAGDTIAKKEDKEYFFSELRTIIQNDAK
ncbi:MAG: hypothetical protein ABFS03_09260 [Chloroflexota bacterium]